jgi:dTDP-4-dehydrorhamnose 3,5-epimerase-like enzyme
MQIEQTELAGVVIVTPKRFGDDRGWFSETWNASTMAVAGLGGLGWRWQARRVPVSSYQHG